MSKNLQSQYQIYLKCIISKKETWFYAHDPELPNNLANIVQKGKQDRKGPGICHVDTSLIHRGVVHYKCLSPGQTVKKYYYLSVKIRLCKNYSSEMAKTLGLTLFVSLLG